MVGKIRQLPVSQVLLLLAHNQMGNTKLRSYTAQKKLGHEDYKLIVPFYLNSFSKQANMVIFHCLLVMIVNHHC